VEVQRLEPVKLLSLGGSQEVHESNLEFLLGRRKRLMSSSPPDGLPSSRARSKRGAAQRVLRRVRAAAAEGGRWLQAAGKEVRQEEDRVGDVDLPIVGDVRRIEARRPLAAAEKVNQREDRIRDVRLAVGVRVGAQVLCFADFGITIVPMTTITCKIPERLHADLSTLARRERVSRSAIVRRALREAVRHARNKPAPIAFDLVKAICGALHGPSDLSTHPKHMEGFGA
jgi:predicted transcriptional regulator